MVEEGEICDDLWFRWSSGWVHWADCRVWCVTCDQEAKCKTRRNARCPVPGACTWRPAAPRDGTILQFSSLVIIFPGRELFKLSFFTGFSSRYFCLIPFCGSVTHTHRLISWLSSRSILLWTLWSLEAHTWSRCHHITHHVSHSWSHHMSHSWLWSGFNHPGDSADDTLTASVKWKFNKISQQKK